MIEAAASAAAIALLNAFREAVDGNWKPLMWVAASGIIALLVGWVAGLPDLRLVFISGISGSGIYTLVTKVGTKTDTPQLG